MTIRFTMDKITRDGDPVLRQVSTAVPFPLSEEHAQLAQDMMTYLVVSQDEEENEKDTVCWYCRNYCNDCRYRSI